MELGKRVLNYGKLKFCFLTSRSHLARKINCTLQGASEAQAHDGEGFFEPLAYGGRRAGMFAFQGVGLMAVACPRRCLV